VTFAVVAGFNLCLPATDFGPSRPALAGFAALHAPVLDCANGPKKENPEEDDEVEENCAQEDSTGEDGETSQEDRKKEICSEEGAEKEISG